MMVSFVGCKKRKGKIFLFVTRSSHVVMKVFGYYLGFDAVTQNLILPKDNHTA